MLFGVGQVVSQPKTSEEQSCERCEEEGGSPHRSVVPEQADLTERAERPVSGRDTLERLDELLRALDDRLLELLALLLGGDVLVSSDVDSVAHFVSMTSLPGTRSPAPLPVC